MKIYILYTHANLGAPRQRVDGRNALPRCITSSQSMRGCNQPRNRIHVHQWVIYFATLGPSAEAGYVSVGAGGVYVYVYMCRCEGVCIRVNECIHMYLYNYIWIDMNTFIYVNICTYMYIYVYINIYIHIHIHIHIHKCIYIHMYKLAIISWSLRRNAELQVI